MTAADQHPSPAGGLWQRGLLVLATVALAIVGGLDASPVFDSFTYYLITFTRGTVFYNSELIYRLTTAAIAMMTLLIAGIPAAVYERLRGQADSTPASLSIWLAATALLSLPTLMALLG